MKYDEFIRNKSQLPEDFGFNPDFMPDMLFDFQKHLVEWAARKGRAAIFADCGLGKTPIQLTWAQNVVRKENKPVLILTPLAVSGQTVHEGEKFGIDCRRVRDGNIGNYKGIVVTNYERLHYFKPEDFGGAVCDESSILKNFAGKTRQEITEFVSRHKYRLLCTATAAPNDYLELGTSSEALGYLRRAEMLAIYFTHDSSNTQKWSLKGHANREFWRWVLLWARAMQKPSDMGFDDNGFDLPDLVVKEYVVRAKKARRGFLFDVPAVTLDEQREERRRTTDERCEMVAELVLNHGGSCVSWCHLNNEGNILNKMIDGSVQVSGSDSDEKKEHVFENFQNGNIKYLVTKPSIAGWGLNWQHCSHQTFFPSHSFEQWYQSIRRSWRFGQKNSVKIDVVSSEGESGVVSNLQRKARAAELMFKMLVDLLDVKPEATKKETENKGERIPSWL